MIPITSRNTNFILLISSLIIFFLSSCVDEIVEPELQSETLTINKFIYDNMNIFYFWNEDIPYINYKEESDSKAYFYKLLKNPDDKWSFITDDISALENYFKGIIKSPGYSIQGYYLNENSNQVYFVIEYVYQNSPASEAGLQRGDIFYKINNIELTDENYQDLLNADKLELTLGQKISSNEIIAIEPTVNIYPEENLKQHPILATNIIEKEGTIIAYLAYSSFISDHDQDLSDIFMEFKNAGVNELVLDLRYNSGGSVASAQKLASKIVPSKEDGKLLIREKYNTTLSENNFDLNFKIESDNLNLNRVYILTTENTASASEMIIYGLDPYMDVIQIGKETHGKYYASYTISDNNEDPDKRRHNWAIQPIVLRSENATNNINYQQGLIPDYELNDNVYNADLGNEDEHFLATAISHITTGNFSPDIKSSSSKLQNNRELKNLKEKIDPLYGTMFINTPELK